MHAQRHILGARAGCGLPMDLQAGVQRGMDHDAAGIRLVGVGQHLELLSQAVERALQPRTPCVDVKKPIGASRANSSPVKPFSASRAATTPDREACPGRKCAVIVPCVARIRGLRRADADRRIHALRVQPEQVPHRQRDANGATEAGDVQARVEGRRREHQRIAQAALQLDAQREGVEGSSRPGSRAARSTRTMQRPPARSDASPCPGAHRRRPARSN